MVPVGAMCLEIVNFCENPPESANVDRLFLEFSFAHKDSQLSKDLLGPSESERRQQNRTFSFQCPLDGGGQSFRFSLASKSRRQLPISTSCCQDQNVGFNIVKAGAPQEGLVMKADV